MSPASWLAINLGALRAEAMTSGLAGMGRLIAIGRRTGGVSGFWDFCETLTTWFGLKKCTLISGLGLVRALSWRSIHRSWESWRSGEAAAAGRAWRAAIDRTDRNAHR